MTTRPKNKIVVATNLDVDMWDKIFLNCNIFQSIQMDEEISRCVLKLVFKFKESNDHIILCFSLPIIQIFVQI
jgi:hypothetical protein